MGACTGGAPLTASAPDVCPLAQGGLNVGRLGSSTGNRVPGDPPLGRVAPPPFPELLPLVPDGVFPRGDWPDIVSPDLALLCPDGKLDEPDDGGLSLIC